LFDLVIAVGHLITCGNRQQDDLGCGDFAMMPMADIRAALKAWRDPAALALKARLAEVAHRYAKRRRGPVRFAALRMRDLETIFLDRYGGPLPDDDAGLGDARVAVDHLANLHGNQGNNIFSWLARWAPWMADGRDVNPMQSKSPIRLPDRPE
jgi:hypothetical protein